MQQSRVLLYSTADAVTHARLRGTRPSPGALAGWEAMRGYAYGARCRQQIIVEHFAGEAGATCGICDVCADPEGTRRAAAQAQAEDAETKQRETRRRREDADAGIRLLPAQQASAVEFVAHLKKPVGKALIAKGLRGSKAKAVRAKGLRSNPMFGELSDVPERSVLDGLEALLLEGRLSRKGRKYPTVCLPDKAVRAVQGSSGSKTASAPARSRRAKPACLRAELERLRRREARTRGWKPYQVFTNRTLAGIVSARPATAEALLAVRGMGPTRMERFSETILALVRAH